MGMTRSDRKPEERAEAIKRRKGDHDAVSNPRRFTKTFAPQKATARQLLCKSIESAIKYTTLFAGDLEGPSACGVEKMVISRGS